MLLTQRNKSGLPLSPLAKRLMVNAALDKAKLRKQTEDKVKRGDFGHKYNFYGGNRQMFECKDQELMLSGPADTGKTLAALTYLNQLCWEYPGSQNAIVRKTAATMGGSVLQTFQNKVIKEEDGITIFGGRQRASMYIYPNGSTIWVGGLDIASKVLSTERDVIYVNQAEELQNVDWEHLLTRANGRAGNMPFGMVMGDCNPASPTHWIQTRKRKGQLKFLEVSHHDNPSIYNPVTGEITEGGKARLASLERLTGTTRMRLLHGLWAAPEGAIYDMFDETIHKINEQPIPRSWMRIVGVDPYGAYTAAVWLAYDPKNAKLIVYREYYKPFGETTPMHVRNILELSGYNSHGLPISSADAEPIMAWVGGGPSENQSRLDWTAAGIPLLENEIVEVWAQIDRVIQLLNENALLIMDNCVNLLSEIGSYRRKMVNGEVTNDIESKENFHLLDSLRYACAWLLTPVEKQRVGRVEVHIGNY